MSKRFGPKQPKAGIKSPLGVFVLDPNDNKVVLVRLTGGENPSPGDTVIRQEFITSVHAQRFCRKKNAELAAATPEQRQAAIDTAMRQVGRMK